MRSPCAARSSLVGRRRHRTLDFPIRRLSMRCKQCSNKATDTLHKLPLEPLPTAKLAVLSNSDSRARVRRDAARGCRACDLAHLPDDRGRAQQRVGLVLALPQLPKAHLELVLRGSQGRSDALTAPAGTADGNRKRAHS